MNTKNISSKKFIEDYGELTFAKLLSSWRLSLEMSQKDFATRLSITPSSLCDLEKGRKIPSPKRASQIAKKLGLPQTLLVQVALQDQVNQSQLNFKVSVAA
jgi:transcriptional regulator with XRE-family HTH domain